MVHCGSEAQAEFLAALQERMAEVRAGRCTRIKPGSCTARTAGGVGSHEHTSFTFLGYTFRARGVRTKTGKMMTGFTPAISKDALNKLSAQVRSWRLHRRTGLSEADLARWINPIVRGWMNYYGAFRRSALYPLLTRINAYLLRWLRKKHPRLRGRKKAQDAWARACQQRPRYFAHWAWVMTIPAVW